MKTKNDMRTKTEILKGIHSTMSNGIRAGKTEEPRKWLASKGLGIDLTGACYNSAQMHHRKEEAFINELASVGFLIETDSTNGKRPGKYSTYRTFGKEGIVFPLRNKQNDVVNFYAYRIFLETPVSEYLNAEGIYPAYPSADTRTLFIVNTELETATLLESRVMDNKEAVITMLDGELKEQHIQAINGLKDLERILVINKEVNNLSEIKKLFPSIDVLYIQLPADHTLNDMLLNYGAEGIKQLFTEQVVSISNVPVEQAEVKAAITEREQPANGTPIAIKFDRKTAIQVREPFVNAYGFDLTNENAIGFITGGFKFTVLGFRVNSNLDILTATIKVCLNPHIHDEYSYVQKLNLYHNDSMQTYARTAAFQLKYNNVEELKTSLYSLRERLERYRLDEIKNKEGVEQPSVKISVEEQKEAIRLAKGNGLMNNIEALLKQAGLVTETENGLRAFVILMSRFFPKPLHILFQGSKELASLLSEILLSTVPEHQLHTQTSMSASAMYYTKAKKYWENKVLSVSNIDKGFRGAATISEFIQNQYLKRYTTESDYLTRQLYASSKTIEGNICLFGYSDDPTINNKFFNECFFIHLAESQQSNKALLQYFKEESGGFLDITKQQAARKTLRNLQRSIKPMNVVIPYTLDLEIPGHLFQPLRSFQQLLTFIKTVALLHQHQLKVKKDKSGTEYIEATPEHLQIALRLFKSILITQGDILSLGQRNLLESLKMALKEKEKPFKIPEMLMQLKMSRPSFYREFNVLKELNYIVRCGGDKKSGIVYKIAEWNDYTQLKSTTAILDEQLKKVELSFSTGVRKFLKEGEMVVKTGDTG